MSKLNELSSKFPVAKAEDYYNLTILKAKDYYNLTILTQILPYDQTKTEHSHHISLWGPCLFLPLYPYVRKSWTDCSSLPLCSNKPEVGTVNGVCSSLNNEMIQTNFRWAPHK